MEEEQELSRKPPVTPLEEWLNEQGYSDEKSNWPSDREIDSVLLRLYEDCQRPESTLMKIFRDDLQEGKLGEEHESADIGSSIAGVSYDLKLKYLKLRNHEVAETIGRWHYSNITGMIESKPRKKQQKWGNFINWAQDKSEEKKKKRDAAQEPKPSTPQKTKGARKAKSTGAQAMKSTSPQAGASTGVQRVAVQDQVNEDTTGATSEPAAPPAASSNTMLHNSPSSIPAANQSVPGSSQPPAPSPSSKIGARAGKVEGSPTSSRSEVGSSAHMPFTISDDEDGGWETTFPDTTSIGSTGFGRVYAPQPSFDWRSSTAHLGAEERPRASVDSSAAESPGSGGLQPGGNRVEASMSLAKDGTVPSQGFTPAATILQRGAGSGPAPATNEPFAPVPPISSNSVNEPSAESKQAAENLKKVRDKMLQKKQSAPSNTGGVVASAAQSPQVSSVSTGPSSPPSQQPVPTSQPTITSQAVPVEVAASEDAQGDVVMSNSGTTGEEPVRVEPSTSTGSSGDTGPPATGQASQTNPQGQIGVAEHSKDALIKSEPRDEDDPAGASSMGAVHANVGTEADVPIKVEEPTDNPIKVEDGGAQFATAPAFADESSLPPGYYDDFVEIIPGLNADFSEKLRLFGSTELAKRSPNILLLLWQRARRAAGKPEVLQLIETAIAVVAEIGGDQTTRKKEEEAALARQRFKKLKDKHTQTIEACQKLVEQAEEWTKTFEEMKAHVQEQ